MSAPKVTPKLECSVRFPNVPTPIEQFNFFSVKVELKPKSGGD